MFRKADNDVGAYKNVGVIARPYNPRNVECGDTGPGAIDAGCDLMGQTMPAVTGPLIKSGVQVITGPTSGYQNSGNFRVSRPMTESDSDGVLICILAPYYCMRTLVITRGELGLNGTSIYYDIWLAFIALKGMCVRFSAGRPNDSARENGTACPGCISFQWRCDGMTGMRKRCGAFSLQAAINCTL